MVVVNEATKYVKERNTLLDIKLIIKTACLLFGDKHAR